MARWWNENWFGLLLTLGFAGLGVWRLSVYRRSGYKNLPAAVIGFTALAAALLTGALWAVGIPQLLLGSYTPPDADQGWKATQSITLTLGALGLVAASVITYHRQQSLEDQVKTGQEQLEHDRTKFAAEQQRERERGHQERYAQGAQMLADESPAVRIAGLNVITALGKEVPAGNELRQTCINLICAYLRDSSPADTQILAGRALRSSRAGRTRYQVVAAEACRLLPFLLETSHKPDREAEVSVLDLDLHDTHLHTINLIGCTIGTATFDGTTFSELASFDFATFTRRASFTGVTFAQDASFTRTTFTGADFTAATFASDTFFSHATFQVPSMPFTILGDVSFNGATFIGATRLNSAIFTGNVSFDGATFSAQSTFDGATFSGRSSFNGATFIRDARFDQATFTQKTWFIGATFVREALFPEAAFASKARFTRATFVHDARFTEATFEKYSGPDEPDLADAVFLSNPSNPYSGAHFAQPSPDAPDAVEGPPNVVPN